MRTNNLDFTNTETVEAGTKEYDNQLLNTWVNSTIMLP